MQLYKIVTLLVFVSASVHCEQHLAQIASWVRSLRNFPSFALLTADSETKTQPVKGPKLLSRGDFEDYSILNGVRDEDGYPHGENVTLRLEDEHASSGICIGNVCKKAIKQIQGAFVHGLVDGPVHIIYDDDSILYAHARQSVLHGPYFEKTKALHIEEIGLCLSGIKHPQWLISTAYNVALYADGPEFSSDEGCLFAFQGNLKSFTLCGRFSRSQMIDVAVFNSIDTETSEHGLLSVVAKNASHSFHQPYKAAPNLGLVHEIFQAQAVWLKLRIRPKPDLESVFRDPKVSSLDQVHGQSMKTTVTGGPIKCLNVLDLKLLSENTVYEHAALSYPGSGSKWVFELVQYVTGVKDYALWLEHENQYVPNSALLIKSHHQRAARFQKVLRHNYRESELLSWRLGHILQFNGRAILLIRNPYDAVVSYWNHAQAGEHDVTRNVMAELRTEEFYKFAMIEIDLWLELIFDWLTISSPDLVFVVHFENFKEKQKESIRDILSFWKYPLNEVRLECVSEELTIDRHRRRSKVEIPDGYYPPELYEKFDKAIDMASDLLRKYGHEDLPLNKYKHYGQNKGIKDEL